MPYELVGVFDSPFLPGAVRVGEIDDDAFQGFHYDFVCAELAAVVGRYGITIGEGWWKDKSQAAIIVIDITGTEYLGGAIELLSLVKLMCHTDKDSFTGAFNEWEAKRSEFLKEKSTNDDGKSTYKHQRLRSAWLSVKHNMEWLWTFYDYPDLHLPNTNNAMEGLNSSIKDKSRRHKGISVKRRKELIIEVLKAHKPKR